MDDDDLKDIKVSQVRKCNKSDHMIHAAMMQLSLEKGLQQFGKEGEKAPIKEMQQHHDMDTCCP